MGFPNVKSENNVTSNNHIENCHTYVADCCIIATATKWDQVHFFWNQKKKKKLVRLHSSTFVNTHLATCLYLSTLV